MTQPDPSHPHDPSHTEHTESRQDFGSGQRLSVLGWPAWQRVLAVLPVVAVLWLAVWWASAPVQTW